MTRRALAVALCAVVVVYGAARAAAAAGGPPAGTPSATTFRGVPTIGALFANATTTRHACTASVVWSPRGDVLITAAHCVSGTGAGYTFAPGFDDGRMPYGRWKITAVYLNEEWIAHQYSGRDFAFLTVAPQMRKGRMTEIQQVTGANVLGGAAYPKESVTVSGYPDGSDNDPVTCTAPVSFDGDYPAFTCTPYVDGTSGSPWLASTPSGTSVVVGLIGGLHQGGCYPYTSYSSPLGLAAYETYLQAVTGGPGDTAPVPGADGCGAGGL